ncbi:MAG: aldehyde:ferredoxin oxidoreductase [Nitrososphaerales archaeon]|nr:aldehyde:ferredoxin oxidoreductase [Nitrososphaerales archaeon]
MLSRVLYVDIGKRSSWVVDKHDIFSKYLGGSGVASKLLLEEARPGIDPFSPEAPIIFSPGYLVGVFPCMVKAVAMFKSPLTKNLGESHAGGHFSSALRFAGYGALVVRGASEYPVAVKIKDDKVRVEMADSLWGLSPLDVERSLRESHYEGMQSVISCGKAGERLVCYSNVIVDRYHHFGRLGLGAVFGSKRLKAISILGTGEIPLESPLAVKEMYEKLNHEVVLSGKMSKYHDLGTSANMLELNELGALPTHNFKDSRFKGAEGISGEVMAESLLRRKISCPGCPIACIHLAGLRTDFAPEHEKGKKEVFSEEVLLPYNYEPMYALGSNLLLSEAKNLLRLIYHCEFLGLDAMMVGNILAWTTEAFEEGRITLDDTLIKPEWGSVEAYLQIINNIVDMKSPFYAKLAQGLLETSKRYGGREYAMIAGNNGMAGYITGYGSIVGALVGARHSHLSNSGYSIDQKTMNQPLSHEQISDFLIEQEDWLYALYSLGACYFCRGVYTKEAVCEALKTVGTEKTKEELMKMGKEIFHNLYKFKVREGFELAEQEPPKRVYQVQTPHGMLKAEEVKAIIKLYIKKREGEGLRLKPEEKALKELLR